MPFLLAACGPQKIRTELPLETPEPPSDCADDAREEDDSLVAVAGTDKAVVGQRFVKLDGVSCPGDDDWIHGYRPCCANIAVDVSWNAAEGELRVDLVGADGTPFPADAVEASPGKVHVQRDNHGQDFYVRIRNRSGTRLPYTAHVRFNE